MSHENVQVLAHNFCKEEIQNFESVAKKMGVALKDFIYSYFPDRQYCFVTLNTDISGEYMSKHLHFSPNNKEQDSFIRQVNKEMNRYLQQIT